ncbi:ethanolamine utilization protein EutJ [Acetobacterium paludosum]|uniref:Chaperone protein DnaK n=2 Tax=Acetobacterium TaxID=33951 RepID=A0A923HVD0_9FIRM|nr:MULTISPECIES: ethanolamine utilization protein EutJ [Acetobacterium]MBC3797180.1 ethanolamine utilization protein EutJ [Acetobacterium tundrae]MBC3887274.1 ethanolamine utilization protein EutJ [Acetobacterium paludosum]
MDWKSGNDAILEFAELIREKKANPYTGELKVGVDLGTANIVIAVVDENNRPIAGATQRASVVRDGIVVDYIGASQIVRKLKAEVEAIIGVDLSYAKAATAIPPGIMAGNAKIISNVVDSADFIVTNVVDEPTAAATVLGIQDGAVVDVGGGTTGISILRHGDVIFTADEATGGTHMSLVLAGFHHISFEEAEELKRNEEQRKIFPIIKPVVEKMASIVNRAISGYDVDVIYVVGGACIFDDFEKVFEAETGIKTIKPVEPLLVTPLGIAFNCQR